MSLIKSASDLAIMSHAGTRLATIMETLIQEINSGLNGTLDINIRAEELFRESHSVAAFKGYRDYPASVCISINSEVVHGIPADDKYLNDGDLVSLDIGLQYGGFYADMAESFIYGGAASNKKGQQLIAVAQQSMELGIAQAKPGNKIRDIGKAIQRHVEAAGYGIVRDLVGHGIGHQLHEDPQVPNYDTPNANQELKPGMVLAIEPMITIGSWRVFTHSDGWTVETSDNKLAAHVERTVAVTPSGPEILTATS